MKNKKIFVICPVRGITPEYETSIADYVNRLETQGHDVWWPQRDTDQSDPCGLQICKNNRLGIKRADVIHFIWDGKSTGSLFDLGMAFAMHKPVVAVIGMVPPMTNGKSFQNMVYAWEEQGCK